MCCFVRFWLCVCVWRSYALLSTSSCCMAPTAFRSNVLHGHCHFQDALFLHIYPSAYIVYTYKHVIRESVYVSVCIGFGREWTLLMHRFPLGLGQTLFKREIAQHPPNSLDCCCSYCGSVVVAIVYNFILQSNPSPLFLLFLCVCNS